MKSDLPPDDLIQDDVKCLLNRRVFKEDKSWLKYVTPKYRSASSSSDSSNDEKNDPHSVPTVNEPVFCDLAMNIEQLQYYTQHFYKLQPDEQGNCNTPMTKQFFELSSLKNDLLNRIWTTADQNKDGKLNLTEFVLAMHLVVLCVNGVTLKQCSDNLEHLNPYQELVDKSNVLEQEPRLFVSSPSSECALIAPRPMRIRTNNVSNIEERLQIEVLDAKIQQMQAKLSGCKSGSLTNQATVNSEIEACLMYWQRYLRKLKDYRIELESTRSCHDSQSPSYDTMRRFNSLIELFKSKHRCQADDDQNPCYLMFEDEVKETLFKKLIEQAYP